MSVIKIRHAAQYIQGDILLPTSKSISNRALVIQAVTGFAGPILDLSTADDTQLMMSALKSNTSPIHLRNAGTCMRFLTAYFAAKSGTRVELHCDPRMENRPIGELVSALQQIGADIQYLSKTGYPPLAIQGKQLKGGRIELDAHLSSQYVSALMMVAPLIKEPLHIHLSGIINSKPYILMTASLMQQMGIPVEISFPNIHIGTYQPMSSAIQIERDWSSSAFWYELIALSKNGTIHLAGLQENSIQGDSRVASIMRDFGVETHFEHHGIVLTKTLPVNVPGQIDLSDCPDLAPALICTASALQIQTTFTGLHSLIIKESNRLEALHDELIKLGYNAVVDTESFSCIPGIRKVPTSVLNTHQDHRLAMAFAPLSMLHEAIQLKDPFVVDKSYPTYWEDLLRVGFSIQENN